MKPTCLFAAAIVLSVAATGAAVAQDQNQNQADANRAIGDQNAARQGAIATDNAAAVGQYTADMAAYRQSLRDQHHEAVADAHVYDHQQRAYADAMAVWRDQVRACHHGNNNACRAPTPNPADFW